MITAHHHPRSSGDLDILRDLATHATHLDSLPIEDFAALAEVFRIGAQGAEVGKEVRRVLLEALVLQREHFAAYLQLPKFKNLLPRTILAIQGYWQHLWTAFNIQRENEAKSKEGAMIAEGSKEAQRVNSPFDYYRAYQTYPKFGLEQPKMAYSPFPYYYNFQNYPYAQPYHPQQPTSLPTPTPPIKMHNPTPILAPHTNSSLYKPDPQPEPESIIPIHEKEVEKVSEKQKSVKEVQKEKEKEKEREKEREREREKEREKQRSKQKQKGDKSEKSEKGDVGMKGLDSNSQSKAKSLGKKQHEPSKKQPQIPKKQPQPPKKDPKKQREPSPPKQIQGPRSNIINLRFLHCACFGHTISTSQKSFECHQCRNLFHYSCLHLSASDGKSCPFCALSRHHAFTEALPRPIKSGWFEVGNKDCFVTKLHLDADELGTFRKHMALLENDKENAHAIQFRILRINEKAKVKPGRKIIKTSFPLLPNELRKIETRHWIQLKLKQITEPSLIFYLMTMIRLKDKTRIHQDYRILDVIKTPLVDFWEQQEKQAGKKLQVRMTHPVTGKALQLPVRGESCQHLECQDLLFFYEQYQLSAFDGNNRLQCSYCSKPYTPHSKFTADPVMHALLQTRPPGSKRLRLENGKVEWVPVESSESEVQEGEESGSAS